MTDFTVLNFFSKIDNFNFIPAANVADMDLSNSIKNGILYMEDPIDRVRRVSLYFRVKMINFIANIAQSKFGI